MPALTRYRRDRPVVRTMSSTAQDEDGARPDARVVKNGSKIRDSSIVVAVHGVGEKSFTRRRHRSKRAPIDRRPRTARDIAVRVRGD